MIQSYLKPEVIEQCLSDIDQQNVCRYRFLCRSGSIDADDGREGQGLFARRCSFTKHPCGWPSPRAGEVLCHPADERMNKYR